MCVCIYRYKHHNIISHCNIYNIHTIVYICLKPVLYCTYWIYCHLCFFLNLLVNGCLKI